MKKLIATLLVGILGTMGYVVVDKTTDERLADLEATVASQQAIIEEFEGNNVKNLDDMEIGDTLPCSLKNGDTWYASKMETISFDSDEYIKVTIDNFTCKLIKKTKNNLPIFQITIAGTIDSNQIFDGELMQISLKHNSVVDFARRTAPDTPIGAMIENNKFNYTFETDLYGYFTITDYTDIELYKLTIAEYLQLEP